MVIKSARWVCFTDNAASSRKRIEKKRFEEKPKGCPDGAKSEKKGAKSSCKGNTSEMGQVDNDDMSSIHEELSPDEKKDGCGFDELNDDWNCWMA